MFFYENVQYLNFIEKPLTGLKNHLSYLYEVYFTTKSLSQYLQDGAPLARGVCKCLLPLKLYRRRPNFPLSASTTVLVGRDVTSLPICCTNYYVFPEKLLKMFDELFLCCHALILFQIISGTILMALK